MCLYVCLLQSFYFSSMILISSYVFEPMIRFFGPETLALNEYVRNINRQATNAPQNPFDLTSNSTSKKTHLPPGPQGHLSQTALGTEANSSIMPPASEVTRSQRTMSMRIDTRKQAVGIVTGNARTDSYSVYSDSVSNP